MTGASHEISLSVGNILHFNDLHSGHQSEFNLDCNALRRFSAAALEWRL